MFTNLGFVNILVVVVRLWWFRKHLIQAGLPPLMHPQYLLKY